ncbi:MAG: choice-of-anchor Q domain-containing protein, partial [Bacteroidota bacterium]
IYNDASNQGRCTPSLINCVFSNNTASIDGGGALFNESVGGNIDMLLLNCSFSNNTGGTNPSQIYNFEDTDTVTPSRRTSLNIDNCIFWGSPATWYNRNQTAGINLEFTLLSETSTVILSGSGGYASQDRRLGSGLIFAQDPLFTNSDLELQANSPAIDAGNNSLTGFSTDINGNVRTQSGSVDMGAHEFMPSQFYVSTSGSDMNTGVNFTNAFLTLQKALTEAENLGGGVQIYVATGTYKPTQGWDVITNAATTTARYETFRIPDGTKVYGGFSGNETGAITQAILDARDFSTNETILSGDFNDDDLVTGLGQSLSITNNAENAYHVVFTRDVSSATIMDGFTITGGSTTDFLQAGNNLGGGWYNQATFQEESSPTVRNCDFIANSGFQGGGIANQNAQGTIQATFVNCRFTQNHAGAAGGGAYNALDLGGGSTPSFTNCIFSGNRAGSRLGNLSFGRGGGIENRTGNSGVLQPSITNCTFVNNYAFLEGGGIYNVNRSFPIIRNAIFWGNRAGNINFGGSVQLNSWTNGSGSNPTVENSLVEEADQNTITTGNYSGTTVFSGMIYAQNPFFVDAANEDFRLQIGSPAIDAGNNNAIFSTGITTDIAGQVRIQNSTVDMGAHEGNGILVTPTVSLTVSPASANEDAATQYMFTFTFDREISRSQTINFSVGGTADFGTDYTLVSGADTFTINSGSVTIPSGTTSAQVILETTPDMVGEPDETIILTIIP